MVERLAYSVETMVEQMVACLVEMMVDWMASSMVERLAHSVEMMAVSRSEIRVLADLVSARVRRMGWISMAGEAMVITPEMMLVGNHKLI